MARTDDDSWDITESVGATALGVAMARADEARSECPLFTDPYAQLFLDAEDESALGVFAEGQRPKLPRGSVADVG